MIKPVQDLDEHIERVNSSYPDPSERLTAFAVLRRDLTDLLGKTAGYENDARLQVEADGAKAKREPDA